MRLFLLSAVCEVHSSMGTAVQMFCCGDWDPKRVPQGTECLEPLLEAASARQPKMPERSFIGQNHHVIFKKTKNVSGQ